MAIKRCFTNLLSLLLVLQFSLVYMPQAYADNSPGTTSANSQAALNACAGMTDTAAQKKCYVDAAQSGISDAQSKKQVSGEQKVGGDMLSMLLTLGGLSAGVAFLATGGATHCGPATTSAIILTAASVAAFMGEVMAAETYKSKMKAANEALAKINAGSADTTMSGVKSEVANATNTQQEAFNALIKKEEAVIAAAGTKKTLYTLAALGYAAAGVIAGTETILVGGNICLSVQATPLKAPGLISPAELYVDNYFLRDQRVPYLTYFETNTLKTSTDLVSLQANIVEVELLKAGAVQSLTLARYDSLKGEAHLPQLNSKDFKFIRNLVSSSLNLVIPSAKADALMGMAALRVTAAAAGLIAPVTVAMRSLYTHPVSRIAMTVILTANAVFSIAKAGKEASKAKERKSFLEKMRDQVSQSGAPINCAAAGVSQSAAECVTPTSETISAVDGTGAGAGLVAGAYGTKLDGDTYLTTPKCITSTGAYDPDCACKASNTCLNVSSKITPDSFPSGIGVGDALQSLDKITGGTIAAGNLSDASLSAAAAKLNRTNAALAAKNPGIKKAQEDAKKQAYELTNKLSSQISSSGALASMTRPDGPRLTDPKTPIEILEQMKSDIKQEIGKVENKGSTEAQRTSLDLSGLGGEEEKKDEGDTKLTEVMKSEYETGNNDINTNSGSNIFDIVSNRYQRSGIRRLFGIEKSIPVDQAAPTQINK